jgi:GTPase SAR1 family protein
MVYDVTSGQSFADLEGWFSEFRSMGPPALLALPSARPPTAAKMKLSSLSFFLSFTAGAAVPMVVVGNKMDLQTTRQVASPALFWLGPFCGLARLALWSHR